MRFPPEQTFPIRKTIELIVIIIAPCAKHISAMHDEFFVIVLGEVAEPIVYDSIFY